MTRLPQIDRDILTILKGHRGLDQSIKLDTLAYLVNLNKRTVQQRIEAMQSLGCVIGSTDNGYFIPINEAEKTAGITKKENGAYSMLKAVMGYRSAPLEWLDGIDWEENVK